MKELAIIELSDTLVRITCEGGKVLDTRNGRVFSVVETLKEEIRYYAAV